MSIHIHYLNIVPVDHSVSLISDVTSKTHHNHACASTLKNINPWVLVVTWWGKNQGRVHHDLNIVV